MELKALEESKNRIVIEMQGVGHTFCNLLIRELWIDEAVKNASYHIDHPLIGKPKLILETNGEDPKKVLNEAVKRIKKETDKFKTAVKSAK